MKLDSLLTCEIQKKSTINSSMCAMVKSRVLLGMGHPTFNRNPYNWYIKPYYWVDDHPLLYGNNGSLDPSTCKEATFDPMQVAPGPPKYPKPRHHQRMPNYSFRWPEIPKCNLHLLPLRGSGWGKTQNLGRNFQHVFSSKKLIPKKPNMGNWMGLFFGCLRGWLSHVTTKKGNHPTHVLSPSPALRWSIWDTQDISAPRPSVQSSLGCGSRGGRPKGGEEIHDHDPILGFAYFMLGKKSKHHILLNGGLTVIYHGAIRKNSP